MQATGWRIVVFSNAGSEDVIPAFHGFLCERGHKLVGVITSPGPRKRRSDSYLKVVAGGRGLPGVDVIVSNHPSRWAGILEAYEPDLLISMVFPWKIPPEALAVARLGGINYHPAPLPKYRGPNPIGWAIRNCDERLYVTVHRLAPEFDVGPILAQASFPLREDDDIDSLIPRIVDLYTSKVLPEALDRIAAGEPGTPQDESQATAAPVFENDWRLIDWTSPRELIHRQIRSWVGDRDIPRGAIGQIDGRQLVITRARRLPGPASGVQPGSVIGQRRETSMVIQCGDGPLEILEWSELTAPQDATGRS